MNLFIKGRKTVFSTLKTQITSDDDVIWFHVASLGEYEQAVPIIKNFKAENPSYKVLISFFSPSGYEVKKNSNLGDVLVYLPLDTMSNAKRFIELAHPKMAVFIKYEIWPNYLKVLQQKNITTILASALFRKSQVYFKWYGSFMRNALSKFDHFFVQNENSKVLLQSLQYNNVTISGDTRFDRVSHQIEIDNTLEFIEDFKGDHLCLVCGSTWPEDDDILVDYINDIVTRTQVKIIIAPHEIKPEKTKALQGKLTCKTVCYSQKEGKHLHDFDVLIVDTIGYLTKIYDYADVAYVGGAMGQSGLHNILEPATFGAPIVIGKTFKKFPEAKRLQQLAGLFSVKNSEELKVIMDKLLLNKPFRKQTGLIAEHFINSNTGATKIISAHIAEKIKN